MYQLGTNLLHSLCQCILQGFVGRNTAGQHNFIVTCILHSMHCFLNKRINNSSLEGCRNIAAVHLTSCLLLIVQIIDYGGFQTAEAEFVRLIQTCYRKINSMVIAAQCQTLDFRTAGIRQPHNAGNLIEGFACRIITRLSQKLKAIIAGNLQQRRMSAADNQRHERRLQLAVCQKVGKYVAFKMVNTYQRFIRCPGQRLGSRKADKQRADESRSVGNGNSINLLHANACLRQGFINNRHNIFDMLTGSNFRHNATEFTMNNDLGGDNVAKNLTPVLYYGSRSFITAAFNT